MSKGCCDLEARLVCRAVWEVFLEVFQEVEQHEGNGTYTGTSGLVGLREQLEARLAYGPEV